MIHKAIGNHFTGWMCGPYDTLNNRPLLESSLIDICRRQGATVLASVGHSFDGCGVTVMVLLAESHASLHTYPLIGGAFIDVFTCGEVLKPALIAEKLCGDLDCRSVDGVLIRRAIPESSK